MNSPEIEQFLTHLAVEQNVAPSTQNQALAALLFLYQEVLHQPLDRRIDAVRAKKGQRLPVVMSKFENPPPNPVADAQTPLDMHRALPFGALKITELNSPALWGIWDIWGMMRDKRSRRGKVACRICNRCQSFEAYLVTANTGR